jgi:hypothetical protein
MVYVCPPMICILMCTELYTSLEGTILKLVTTDIDLTWDDQRNSLEALKPDSIYQPPASSTQLTALDNHT